MALRKLLRTCKAASKHGPLGSGSGGAATANSELVRIAQEELAQAEAGLGEAGQAVKEGVGAQGQAAGGTGVTPLADRANPLG